MSDKNQIESALEAGRLAGLRDAGVNVDHGIPFVALPLGTVLYSVEQYGVRPARKRAHVTVRDAKALIDYVNRFAEPSTLVFAWLGNQSFTAVIDYHDPTKGGPTDASEAHWSSHRATLTMIPTWEWKIWSAANGKRMTQMDFATFVEDNLPQIASPDGATLLEMVKKLESKKDVVFRSSVRLEDGAHALTYQETINSNSGEMKIPSAFTLGIVPFEGCDKYKLDARFRYRIESGKLSLWYDLLRPELVIADAFKFTMDDIQKGIAAVPVIAAEAPAEAK